MFRFAFCAVAAAAAVFLGRDGAELAAADAVYLEDAPAPRPIAAVHARVLREGGEVLLELVVSPRGEGVEPVPGLDGLPGTNLKTAEELDRLTREGGLRLVERRDGRSIAGKGPFVTLAALPVRVVKDDGHLSLANTPRRWPSSVRFRSAPLHDGRSHCYLEADGVPRLFVHVVRDGSVARIEAIESIAASAHAPQGAVAR